MSIASETPGASGLAIGLGDGINRLSGFEQITFTRYLRLVLPLDGFVFWVNADIVNLSALYNVGAYGSILYNGSNAPVAAGTNVQTVNGAFHFSSVASQREDEMLSVNGVIFSTQTEIEAFNSIAPDELWIGVFGSVRFAFSSRGPFFQRAGLYHYSGDAIYPAFESQIIDTPQQSISGRVLSNSIPLWLSYNATSGAFPIYPGFLAPWNTRPPYATAAVLKSEALQAFPIIDDLSGTTQLVKDTVRLTFYGLRNDTVIDWMTGLNSWSVNQDVLGIMNMPIPSDEPRPQTELGVLAMKKTVLYDVSYYQYRADTTARQLITTAINNLYLE